MGVVVVVVYYTCTLGMVRHVAVGTLVKFPQNRTFAAGLTGRMPFLLANQWC